MTLADWVREARERTLEIHADLSDEEFIGPRMDIVNPPLWEIGHVAWFQEKWVLRHGAGRPPIRPDVDALYDSAAIAHESRWHLGFPSREETLRYLMEVRDRVAEATGLDYLVRYAVHHEDMHDEAFTYTRQTLGQPAPRLSVRVERPPDAGPLSGDAPVPGGTYRIGAERGEPFVFDNEKWAHEVRLEPFAIARAPVTHAEYLEFVIARGYARREWWSDEGWAWRESAGAKHPVYWRVNAGRAERRDFDRWVPLEPHRPVIHVNAFEAEAYCRWAGRRLPTEGEWEVAARFDPSAGRMRRYPWGDEAPTPERANLDWRAMGCVDVGAFPAGDSALSCRQMIGNVWEWTSTTFGPYPGFEPDMYKEYSQPAFGATRVLRGGAWPTRSRLIRASWRNFYTPDRRDVWAGFRTCAS